MKKVKRMMFGGVSKAVGNAAKNAAVKAPVPPPDVQKMIANLPRGSTVAGPGTGLGVKPTVTGAPDKNLPFTINNKPTPNVMGLGTAAQANPRIAPKIGGMLGGGGAGLGSAMQNNPRMAQNIGGIGAALGKRMGMKEGGKVSSASKRADGIAVKGKTKGRMI